MPGSSIPLWPFALVIAINVGIYLYDQYQWAQFMAQ